MEGWGGVRGVRDCGRPRCPPNMQRTRFRLGHSACLLTWFFSKLFAELSAAAAQKSTAWGGGTGCSSVAKGGRVVN